LRDEPDHGSSRTVFGNDVVTAGHNDARCRVDDPADDVDQRRLSGAVRTQQGENLSTTDVQVDVLERLQAGSVGLGEFGYGNYGLQDHFALDHRQ
jgi:hypothetical protein